MSDNAKLIAEARATATRFNDAGLRFGVERLLTRMADALEAAQRHIGFLEEQYADLRDDMGNLDNQLRELSKLIWDYDEWEALARNGNEPAVSVYKLHQVMTEPHE